VLSFPIITEANGVVGKILTRVPVILFKEDENAWLNPDSVEPERVMPLLKQCPKKDIEAYPVLTAVK
jgi:putative SOS response-associated peptidase YedK